MKAQAIMRSPRVESREHAAPSDEATRLAELFGGDRACSYLPGMRSAEDGKNRPDTVNNERTRQPTPALWQKHLEGEFAIGIIAADARGEVKFGTIDVDDYKVGPMNLANEVRRNDLPLLTVETKSGGAHLLLFASEPVSADVMDRALRSATARLGLVLKDAGGSTEVITTTNVWMPYPGALAGDKALDWGRPQSGVKHTGSNMGLSEFVRAAERARLSPPEVAKLAAARPVRASTVTDERGAAVASQRLKQLCDQLRGMSDGEGRNDLLNRALHEMGRYVGADCIERDVVERELRQVADAVGMDREKTDAIIRRKNGPMARGMREPPPRGDEDFPQIVAWRKIVSDKPEWIMTLAGSAEPLRITRIDDITRYHRFRDQCLAQLNRIYSPIKEATWSEHLREASALMTVEEAPEDLTREGMFREQLGEYLTNRSVAMALREVRQGKPFLDDDHDRYIFTMAGVHDFLTKFGGALRDVTRPEILAWLEKRGGGRVAKHPVAVAPGETARLLFVPRTAVDRAVTLEPPVYAPPGAVDA